MMYKLLQCIISFIIIFIIYYIKKNKNDNKNDNNKDFFSIGGFFISYIILYLFTSIRNIEIFYYTTIFLNLFSAYIIFIYIYGININKHIMKFPSVKNSIIIKIFIDIFLIFL